MQIDHSIPIIIFNLQNCLVQLIDRGASRRPDVSETIIVARMRLTKLPTCMISNEPLENTHPVVRDGMRSYLILNVSPRSRLKYNTAPFGTTKKNFLEHWKPFWLMLREPSFVSE
jgi:hypothetical protein